MMSESLEFTVNVPHTYRRGWGVLFTPVWDIETDTVSNVDSVVVEITPDNVHIVGGHACVMVGETVYYPLDCFVPPSDAATWCWYEDRGNLAMLLEHLHGRGESGRILIAAVRCPTAFVDEFRLARAIAEHEAATGHTCRPNTDMDWYCDTGDGSECDWHYTITVDHIARGLSLENDR